MTSKDIYYIIAIVALLLLVAHFGRREEEVFQNEVKETRVDTIRVVQPVTNCNGFVPSVKVNIPTFVFVERKDSVVKDYLTTDSVTMNIDIEHKLYADSLCSAQISGPKVGDYGPTIDWIEVYPRSTTTTITRTEFPRNYWEVWLNAGAIASKSPDLYAGEEARRVSGRWYYGAEAGYNLIDNSPFIRVKGGFKLLRK